MALQADAKIVGRDVFATPRPGLETLPLLREAFGQLLHHVRDQPVRVLGSAARLVDEPRLHLWGRR